jgi:hypothetical protein
MADNSTPQNGTPVSSTPASVPLPPVRPADLGSVPLPPPRPSNLEQPPEGASDAKPENGDAANANENQSQTSTSAPDTPNIVVTGDLPWAVVLLPTTSSGVGGVGESKHHLQVGDWVFGFFADGDSCQQPVIVGTFPGGPGGGNGSFGGNGSKDSSGNSNLPAANIPQSEAQKVVYQKLRAIGFNHIQTAGIMGNLQVESGFKVSAEGDKNTSHNTPMALASGVASVGPT